MFLFDHRSISYYTTQRRLAYFMFKRKMRTHFDLLEPNVAKTVDAKQREQIVASSGKRKVVLEQGGDIIIDEHVERTTKG